MAKAVKEPKLVKVEVVQNFTQDWNVGDQVEIPEGDRLDFLLKEEKVKEVNKI